MVSILVILHIVLYLAFSTAKPTLSDILKNYADAYAFESSNWIMNVSMDPFYRTPRDMELSFVPGDYIRFEETIVSRTSYHSIPEGLSLYRLLYVSQDINNKSVPASAYVLVPYISSSTPLRVIAWAHGTSGIQRQCAPSNQFDLYYSFEAPFAMALQGYLVIAPDYAGQGSDTPFNYMASSSHAVDISHAISALRKYLRYQFMTYEWLAVGHSEGGSAVWALNEREVHQPTGGFLGSVAIAPALQSLALERYKLENHLPFELAYPSYKLSAMAQLYPSINTSVFYTELGLKLRDLAETSCAITAFAIFRDLSFTDVFRDNSWLNTSWALDWEKSTSITGEHVLAQPMLLIQGLDDIAIHPILETVFADHCKYHPDSTVHLTRYPATGHDGVAFVSQPEMFDWISGRFENVRVLRTCSHRTIELSRGPFITNTLSFHVQDMPLSK